MRHPRAAASSCNATFHKRMRSPFLPPASAVTRRSVAWGDHPRAQLRPPATERLGRTLRGVMLPPHPHPAGVGGEVVDPRRAARAQLLVDQGCRAPLARVPQGRPCAPGSLAIPEPFLLLRLHRSHGVPALLKRPAWLGHRRAWRIALTRRPAVLRLPLAWQALVESLKPPGHGGVTDVRPWWHQSVGEVPGARAGPQHRRLRVPTRGRRPPRWPSLDQGPVPRRPTSPSPAAPAPPLALGLMSLCTT
jgi:hypothetical protein